ncbi:MAG: hypothetical protein WKF84_21035 [Pyrinomonadaceae bacterium]
MKARDNNRAGELQALYLNYLIGDVGAQLRLDGLRLAVDCAHGAASQLAPELFSQLGATVIPLNNNPNGRNINLNCGSLHLEELGRRVVADKAHLGVAYDGDADRALFVNDRGEVVDGDATLWAMAKYFNPQGELKRLVVSSLR